MRRLVSGGGLMIATPEEVTSLGKTPQSWGQKAKMQFAISAAGLE
jgi:hypothetical protein